MIGPARVAAYEILSAVSAGNADLPTAIAFARGGLRDDRDRALAADIASGVQRWRATIDHVIGTFSKRPPSRLDSEIVEILRLSIYQLLHLTRVPASAVVDDAVNLVRRAGKTSATGFVNAVLREVSRRRDALPLPPRPADPSDRDAALDYFSVALSHPRWLAARWYDRLGFEIAEQWMQFNNTPGTLTLRANRLKVTRDELAERLRAQDVELHAAPYAPDGLIVDAGYPLRLGLDDAGFFFVQDEASQLVALLAGDRPPRLVLDACASPGGKTTAIAAAMSGNGLLVATDLRDRRLALLRRTVAASGATNVRIVQMDVRRPLPFRARFDCVLVDAPCSGLGTLRRDPDIRWRRRDSDIAALAATELTMLRQAAAIVAPGGRLVYATCSSEPEENEQVVDAFAAETRDFIPASALSANSQLTGSLIDARGFLRTEPHRHQLESFFGAVFTRRG
ncbi:MAG TPA: 16S rRNA (cytosine(967)-C(5))-methyltransferase RsmB [Vicinamibacterales bacterium]|nr:16S rRNA (cytosine(967)-C(5))-methyltransferase RsmB [Vicinamibacterales bacterium]